jgi:hypothetical protein
MFKHLWGAAIFGLLCLGQSAFAQQTAENDGPNANIVRWAEGIYRYLDVSGERARGSESFRLNVHPDGTRTMVMWHDLFARNRQFTAVMRVDDSFRPLEAFVTYWNEGGYKGSSLVTVNGTTLTAITNGPVGRVEQTMEVPQTLSIGTHPVSADGWHAWHADASTEEPQKSGALYNIESGDDLTKPPIGSLTYMTTEMLGTETVTVPAGTFETSKHRLAGRTTVWVTGPDNLVVRMANASVQYVLEELTTGDNAD